MSVPYIHTKDGITVVLKGKPYHAAKDDAVYGAVVDHISWDDHEDDVLATFEAAGTKLKAVASKLSANLVYEGGVVKYQGEVMANYAVDFLIRAIESNEQIEPLVNFLENLLQNPSKRVVDDLYRFLEKGKMPITPDGHFLAYKKVRKDYKDIHSAKFDNSVGQKYEMPRNKVDEDANRTCSVGFHVCSYDYLPNFASSGDDRVMVCKVNPAHVVAIPADYNDTKMRVYKYEVTAEVTDYFKAGEKVLSSAPVMAEKRDFVVLYDNDDFFGHEEQGTYWTFDEAKREAVELASEGEYDRVWVENLTSGDVLYEAS